MKKKVEHTAVKSALQLYLKDINEFPLLTIEKERKLIAKVKKGDEEARATLIKSNLRLVISIAKNYVNRGLSFLDLIDEGNIGLLKSINGFKAEMGCKFSTYATWWIRQAISRALANTGRTIRIPTYMNDNISKMKNAAAELTSRLERKPNSEELAMEMDITSKKISKIERALQPAHVYGEEVTSSEFVWALSEIIADPNTRAPDEELIDCNEKQNIDKLLDVIDLRAATILRMRFGLDDGTDKTLQEVGERLNITRERVRQIEKEALRKLHYITSKDGGSGVSEF
ncbi:MAG: sigma-70 family RNA polymerase sigma factor [Candidatus Anammoxibacter sp.]